MSTETHEQRWSYGVTTTPERIHDFLPRTLRSLSLAGFNEPRLFADGALGKAQYWRFGSLEVSPRYPRIGPYPNWVLSAWELYFRDLEADFYALFQDDLVAVANLRTYLERTPYPEGGYLNLYTANRNEKRLAEGNPGWHEPDKSSKWQGGRGAVGLVFSREAFEALIASSYLSGRMRCFEGLDGGREKNGLHPRLTHVDGAVATAMNLAGWREYVHLPSLVQHTGLRSVIGTRPSRQAATFPGEEFDAMTLLEGNQWASAGRSP